jgi:hypothetical protein
VDSQITTAAVAELKMDETAIANDDRSRFVVEVFYSRRE